MQDVKAPIAIRKNADGSYDFQTEAGPVHVPDPAQAKREAEVSASNGRALLAELRQRSGPLIRPHQIGGTTWYLLVMSEEHVNEVAIRTRLRGDGGLQLHSKQVFKALVLSTLEVGVVSGPNDPTPYFNSEPYLMQDAYGNMIETTEVEQACQYPAFDTAKNELFDKLTDWNPLIFPKKKEVLALAAAAEAQNQTGPTSTNDSTPSTEKPSLQP